MTFSQVPRYDCEYDSAAFFHLISICILSISRCYIINCSRPSVYAYNGVRKQLSPYTLPGLLAHELVRVTRPYINYIATDVYTYVQQT